MIIIIISIKSIWLFDQFNRRYVNFVHRLDFLWRMQTPKCRSHFAWFTFTKPRMKIARQLKNGISTDEWSQCIVVVIVVVVRWCRIHETCIFITIMTICIANRYMYKHYLCTALTSKLFKVKVLAFIIFYAMIFLLVFYIFTLRIKFCFARSSVFWLFAIAYLFKPRCNLDQWIVHVVPIDSRISLQNQLKFNMHFDLQFWI